MTTGSRLLSTSGQLSRPVHHQSLRRGTPGRRGRGGTVRRWHPRCSRVRWGRVGGPPPARSEPWRGPPRGGGDSIECCLQPLGQQRRVGYLLGGRRLQDPPGGPSDPEDVRTVGHARHGQRHDGPEVTGAAYHPQTQACHVGQRMLRGALVGWRPDQTVLPDQQVTDGPAGALALAFRALFLNAVFVLGVAARHGGGRRRQVLGDRPAGGRSGSHGHLRVMVDGSESVGATLRTLPGRPGSIPGQRQSGQVRVPQVLPAVVGVQRERLRPGPVRLVVCGQHSLDSLPQPHGAALLHLPPAFDGSEGGRGAGRHSGMVLPSS